MKLIACHIENFGKLSELTLQFSDGLNVINEANAWGKSTLAAFLKAMFYGLDSKKELGAFEKERVMYRPWQGGAFGGEVDFSINGKKYRISRTFGRTEKADIFHLYDLSTNLESFDYTENIGYEIFELDSTSFKRSIFIAQNDCSSEASDGISAKLGNLAETTDDINNYENANKQLRDIINQLTPERVTGSIKKRKNYMTQLAEELRGFEAAQTGLEGIQHKEQLVLHQIQELTSIRKNYAQALVKASEESRKSALYSQYDAMCQDVEEKEKKRDSYKQFFPAGVPTTAEFQTQMQNISKLSEAQAKASSFEFSEEELEEFRRLADMFYKEVPTDEDIDHALEMFAEIDKQKEEIARQESIISVYQFEVKETPVEPKFFGAVAYKVFLALGIIMAVVGVAALGVWYYNLIPMVEPRYPLLVAIAAGTTGALSGIVGTILGVRVSNEKQNWHKKTEEEKTDKENLANILSTRVNDMKEEVRIVHGIIGEFLANYRVYCEVSDYQSRLYELKNEAQEYLRCKEQHAACESETAIAKEVREKVDEFAKRYQFTLGEDYATELNQLQTKAAEYQMAEIAFKEVSEKKQIFEQAQDKSFWTKEGLCPYSLEELNALIAQTDAKLEECKAAKMQYAKQLEALQEQLDLRDEKQAELEELYATQEKDLAKYKLLKMTLGFLQAAKEQLIARYLEPISEGFAKYYGKLTGDTSASWMIDANINLQVHQEGEFRETYWLSAGYQDLIGVCMRLALVDAMYRDEKPFLILDDPFVNLDKNKVEAGNELLLNVSKEYQVIYFTCHDSRSPKNT